MNIITIDSILQNNIIVVDGEQVFKYCQPTNKSVQQMHNSIVPLLVERKDVHALMM